MGVQMEKNIIEGTDFYTKEGNIVAHGANIPNPYGTMYGALTFDDRKTVNDVIVDANLDTLLYIEEPATFYFKKWKKFLILVAIDNGRELYTLNEGRLVKSMFGLIGGSIFMLLIAIPLSLFIIGLPLLFFAISMLWTGISSVMSFKSVDKIRRAHKAAYAKSSEKLSKTAAAASA
jgi:hypothetical protein